MATQRARELIGDRPYEQLNLAGHKVYGYGQNYRRR